MEKETVFLRKCAKDLSLRRRHERLTADNLVQVERLQKTVMVLVCKLRRCDEEEKVKLSLAYKVVCAKLLHMKYHIPSVLDRPLRLDRTIESFSDSDCYLFFRFTKSHLHELTELLGFVGNHRFKCREVMNKEEIFLRGLYELVSGETKYKIAANVFGREQSSQSRAFYYFIYHISDSFGHLLTNNLKWWYKNGFFERSAEAIGNKLALGSEAMQSNAVSHFIDCNCLETERVGGGPTQSGANSARWDPHIQRAFYNGWKSMNGLKHQTVDDAYGFTIDCFGPASLRRNDLCLLRDSDINDRFARLQLHSEDDLIIFGDSAYKRQTHIRSYFKDIENVDGSTLFNSRMRSLRQSIEWNYGHQASLFKMLCITHKMQVLKSPVVTRLFLVTTLLRNIHTGYYGCQTSKYFDLKIPDDFNYKYIVGEDFE